MVKILINLIVFLLPTYLIRFQIGSLPTTLLELLLLTLFAVYGWYVFKDKLPRPKLHGWQLPLGLFFLASIIAVLVSPDQYAALGLWRAYFLEPIIFFIILINVLTAPKDYARLFNLLGLSLIAVSLVGIWQKFFPEGFFGFWSIPNEFWAAEATRRVTGVYGFPNAIGLFGAPIVVWHFGLLLASSARKKFTNLTNKLQTVFSLAVVIISSLAIYFAHSEGALVAIVAGMIIISLALKKTRLYTAPVIALLILIAVLTPTIRPTLSQKLTLNDESGLLRREIWTETVAMLKDRPIFGAGLHGYQTALASYHQKPYIEIYLYPHNLFLNFWTELGLLGVFAFIWLTLKAFYLANKHPSETSLIFATSLFALLLHGLVDVPYFKNDLSILFWLLIAGITMKRNLTK